MAQHDGGVTKRRSISIMKTPCTVVLFYSIVESECRNLSLVFKLRVKCYPSVHVDPKNMVALIKRAKAGSHMHRAGTLYMITFEEALLD